MHIKRIKFTDFNGDEREQNFYFNLTQSEIAKMEITKDGGLVEYIQKVIDKRNGQEVMDTFEWLILSAYGEKSDDGLHFKKNDEIRSAFKDSAAYDVLFMEILTDSDKAAEFFNGIVEPLTKDHLPSAQ